MSEPIYRKVMKGKRTTYEQVTPEDATIIELTDAQCITAAGALGVTLLSLFERHFPPHKRVARKIKAVEESILDLFHGSGEKLDEGIAEHFCKAWDKTMREMSA